MLVLSGLILDKKEPVRRVSHAEEELNKVFRRAKATCEAFNAANVDPEPAPGDTKL